MKNEQDIKAQATMTADEDQTKPLVVEDAELADAPEDVAETLDGLPPEDAVVTPAPRRGRGWMAVVMLLLIGGLGFAAAWVDVLKLRGEDPVPGLQAQVSALAEQVAAGEAALAAMKAQVETADPGADVAALAARVEAAEAQLEVLAQAPAGGGSVTAANFAALAGSVAALKDQVGGLSGAPADDAMVRAAVDQAMADWTAARAAEAEAAVEAARVKAGQVDAVQRIRAAALSGAPYGDALAALDGLAVDAVISGGAEAGLPTLAALTDSFPDAARAALDASRRAEAGEGFAAQLGNFLDIQTGARSLEPREGDDPDAVLSRAEAAVRAGDVATALTELAGLPEVGRAVMADWIAQAEKYQAVEVALAALSTAVGL